MTSSPSAIKVENLTKTYPDDNIANADINLTVYEGEFFSLLGPNGAGKSTLVKQITSEIKPTAGRVYVSGINIQNAHVAAKYNMGIMPQECSLFEHLSVKEHLTIFSRLKQIRGAGNEIARVLEALHLADQQKKRIGELSFGMKRQILLATTLLGNPPILILDEPTTGLDPEARTRVLKTLLGLKNDNKTIFLTTHNMDEAEYLSDRIGIIVKGKIIHCDSVETLRSLIDRNVELRFRRNTGEIVSERFKCTSDALTRLPKNGIKDFSLATISLENVYLDLVRNANN